MRVSLFIIGLLLIAIAFFEFSPAVEEARSHVSRENYENAAVSCQALLGGRPWYGVVNFWFFAWLIFAPALIFSVTPRHPAWMRGGRVIVAAGVCYALMNLAIHLQWDIRNAPFRQDPFHPDPANGWRMDCANYAGDGFSNVMASQLAWIPACIYTGFCLLVWRFYHLRLTGEITDDYEGDVVTRTLFRGLKVYFIILLLYMISLSIFIGVSYFMGDPPFHPGILGFISLFITRPLFIPIEIFNY